MVGAGFMGQGLTNQIVNSVPGMRMVAIVQPAARASADVFQYAGLEPYVVDDQASLEDVVGPAAGRARTTRSCSAAASRSTSSCEVTGSVEFGARVCSSRRSRTARTSC